MYNIVTVSCNKCGNKVLSDPIGLYLIKSSSIIRCNNCNEMRGTMVSDIELSDTIRDIFKTDASVYKYLREWNNENFNIKSMIPKNIHNIQRYLRDNPKDELTRMFNEVEQW